MGNAEQDRSAGPQRILTPLLEETLTKPIIGAFYEVYNQLDFGFLEGITSRRLPES